ISLFPLITSENYKNIFKILPDFFKGDEAVVFCRRLDVIINELGVSEAVLEDLPPSDNKKWHEVQEKLEQVMQAFIENNSKLPPGRQTNVVVFEALYLPLVYALETFLPGQGATDVIGLFKKSSTPEVVVRFLKSKESFLKDSQQMKALGGVFTRMKNKHMSLSRKKFTLETGSVFKILNTIAAFVDLGYGNECEEILNSVSDEMSLSTLVKYLEDSFLKYLSSYFGVSSKGISPDVRKSLYMPYIPRLKQALEYIKERQSLKYKRSMALILAMLENRFWDFIENTKQKDVVGLGVAKHNVLVRKALKQVNVNTERWLGKVAADRMPDADFMYYQNSTVEYDPVADVKAVINYLKSILNMEVDQDQRNSLIAYLVAIGIEIRQDSEGKVLGFNVVGDTKKKDIIAIIGQKSVIENLLSIQNDFQKKNAGSLNIFLLETIAHWGERISILQERLENPNYEKELGMQRQFFKIRPIMRNPGHDLFIGDFTNCCLAMNSGFHPDAMIERLFDEGLNVVEVIDENTQQTMAAAWLYIAVDGSLVVQNLEINAAYERTKPLMDALGGAMIDYAREFSVYIGAKRLL
ncbi:MAG: hypothetical protein WCI27_11920, partial [Candidatus Omnitrophota bacterium]